MKSIFKREHSSQAGGDILSNTVANHCCRPHPMCHPPLCQRVFDAEQCGLRIAGVGKFLARRRDFLFRRKQQAAQVEADVWNQSLSAQIQLNNGILPPCQTIRGPYSRTASPDRRT